MNLHKIEFPIYKLRAYLNIDTNLLGITKITTIKGEFIFDDDNIKGNFLQRRLKLSDQYSRASIYKLNEQVLYLRQLVKYKSGTSFVDINGIIFTYKKSSKLFQVKSLKILRKKEVGTWTIIHVDNIEHPYIVGNVILSTTKYASIMGTSWGPFLYDLTSKKHEIYRRKI